MRPAGTSPDGGVLGREEIPPLVCPAASHHAERMDRALAKLMHFLKPKRRWTQFSLRTVLLLTAVSCVALNLWVVPAERQRRAVAAIRARGCYVFYAEPSGTARRSLKAAFLAWKKYFPTAHT